MPKTRLNMLARERIQKRLIERAYDHRQKELEARRPILAKAAFDHLFSPVDQAQAAKLPEGWLPLTNMVEIKGSDGYAYPGPHRRYISWDLAFPERYPAHLSLKLSVKDMSDTLLLAFDEQVKAETELAEQRSEAARNTVALLASYQWVEDLIAGWPEVASIVHEVIGTTGVIKDLPAVTNLNKLLDLPPGGDRAPNCIHNGEAQ